MSQWVFFGVLALLGILAFRFLLSSFFRILFLLLALIGLGIWCYIAGVWPFEKNVLSVAGLQQRYCEVPGKATECDCLVKILDKDLRKRFTPQELKEIQDDRVQWTYVFYKEVEANREPIKKCLEAHNVKEDPMHWIARLLPGGSLIPKDPELEKEEWKKLDEKF